MAARLSAFVLQIVTSREDSNFRLKRSGVLLPTASDFDPYGGGIDAYHAWKHFGGLSISQAFDLFTTNPLYYQEDFMFMGSKAFKYYLPVIDRYLHEISGDEESDGCEAAILGSGVVNQFGWEDSALSGTTVAEIEQLSTFVLANLARYSPEHDEQQRIAIEWKLVNEEIIKFRNRSGQNAGADGPKEGRRSA